MIAGYGLDVVEVARFAEIIEGSLGDRFKNRVFTAAERRYCEQNTMARAVHYAGRFAAKEALLKALGAPEGISWQDIEVSSDGQPRLTASGRCSQEIVKRGVTAIHLSLSHDGGVAIAGVILER